MVAEINEKYYSEYPDLRIRFEPIFHWNKGHKSVIKIGIRATNTLVSATAKENTNEDFNGYVKKDIINFYKLSL